MPTDELLEEEKKKKEEAASEPLFQEYSGAPRILPSDIYSLPLPPSQPRLTSPTVNIEDIDKGLEAAELSSTTLPEKPYSLELPEFKAPEPPDTPEYPTPTKTDTSEIYDYIRKKYNIPSGEEQAEELKEAQSRARKAELAASLAEAGAAAGATMAGIRHSPDFFTRLREQARAIPEAVEKQFKVKEEEFKAAEAAQKVETNLEKLAQEKDANNPNSEASYQARVLLRTLYPAMAEDPHFNSLSAAQIDDFIKKLSTGKKDMYQAVPIEDKGGIVRWGVFNKATGTFELTPSVRGFAPTTEPYTGEKTGQQGLAGEAGKRKAAEEAYKTAPPSKSAKEEEARIHNLYNSLTPVQRKSLERARKAFNADIDKVQDALNAARSIQTMLGKGTGPLDETPLRMLQNQLARATGERGAMTEADVQPFGGRQAILAKIEQMLSIKILDKIPAEDRKYLMSVAKKLEECARKNIGHTAEFFIKNFSTETGIPADDVKKLLGADVFEQSTPPTLSSEQLKRLEELRRKKQGG